MSRKNHEDLALKGSSFEGTVNTHTSGSNPDSGETIELGLPLSPLSPTSLPSSDITHFKSEDLEEEAEIVPTYRPRPPKKDRVLSPHRNVSNRSKNYNRNDNSTEGGETTEPKLRRWVSSASSRNPNLVRKKSRMINKEKGKAIGVWTLFSWLITCCFPPFLLKCFGLSNKQVQQAWREKISLVFIILFISAILGFITFALEFILCGDANINKVAYKTLSADQFSINGIVYDLRGFVHPETTVGKTFYKGGFTLDEENISAGTKDLSFLFQSLTRQDPGSCKNILFFKDTTTEQYQRYFPCVAIDPYSSAPVIGNNSATACHFYQKFSDAYKKVNKVGDMFFKWEDVANKNNGLIVYGGNVLDLSRLKYLTGYINMDGMVDDLTNPNGPYLGKDVSYFLRNEDPVVGKCLTDLVRVGMIDTSTVGCLTSTVIQFIILIVIISVVICKFFMAIFFSWIVSWRLGSLNERTYMDKLKRYDEMEAWAAEENEPSTSNSEYSLPGDSALDITPINGTPNKLKNSIGLVPSARNSSNLLYGQRGIGEHAYDSEMRSRQSLTIQRPTTSAAPEIDPALGFALHYTISLVTCYSEGYAGIKSTLDSLANTNYPNNRQLLFVVCDGVITGAGNDKTTPDICLSLMKDFIIPPEMVQPHSYVAIAEGSRRHNMAKVYAGYYYQTPKKGLQKGNDINNNEKTESNPNGMPKNRVPMVLVIKCGTPEEAKSSKPGNRGKRDSQVLLMSFLQKAVFDDRMTKLEYELFNAIWNIAGVTSDIYETVLMVDADTTVFPDSITRMVACFSRDPKVMGLCGETKIANKAQSWVTMIQVFEYYISHHLSKAFESVFGGVTCLPGCFSMYRIKTPKSNGDWVPILCNPEILQQYSENIVTSLHQKNLLLLGEDRYLTTLMLRTFPKRKLIFVPQAICKTVVPDSFSVLLSQRRRWINSTVHNLLELVITRDLCGTFCFSMQFIVFMELIGTVVLPAAICFTIYLLVKVALSKNPSVIPLVILALILGLPAVLILLTTRQITYVFWMFIYLLALPIWNFILPLYAFWHFDDFSWGQTRMIAGGDRAHHGSEEGEFDASNIVMKRWEEFERDKRRRTVAVLSQYGTQASLPSTIVNEPYKFGNSAKNLAFQPEAAYSRLTLDSQNSNAANNLDNMGYMSPMALKRVSKVFAAEEEINSILADNYANSNNTNNISVVELNNYPELESQNSLPWRSLNSLNNPRASTSALNVSRLSLMNNNGSNREIVRSSIFDPAYRGNGNDNIKR